MAKCGRRVRPGQVSKLILLWFPQVSAYFDPVDGVANFPDLVLPIDGACQILTLRGLNQLDGDFALASRHDGRPAWAGSSPWLQHEMLMWDSSLGGGSWALGVRGVRHDAFLAMDSLAYPPASSSRWMVAKDGGSSFEPLHTPVTFSCPVCEAVEVHHPGGQLGPCSGNYRLSGVHGPEGGRTYTHVTERCILFHNPAAGAFSVTLTSRDSSTNTIVHHWKAPTRLGIEDGEGGVTNCDSAEVHCTSAGSTTHLIFRLERAYQDRRCSATSAGGGGLAGGCQEGQARGFRLTTRQDGSIINERQASVHLTVIPPILELESDLMELIRQQENNVRVREPRGA
ncbi:unnamed protein product, partial [Discosporangium mesarthrocarpum]